MKKGLLKFSKLILGFILCAIAVVLSLNSNMGLSAWDVLHQGISINTGITIGNISILVGVVFVALGMIMGQEIGIGTLLNMTLIGKFIDIIIEVDILPHASGLVDGVIMTLLSIMLMSLGCYFYISCGLGCGPRDGVMVVLSRKLNKPIKLIRTCMEGAVLICGWILGGKVGIGTVISALLLGFTMQMVFNINKFDPTKIHHNSIAKSLHLTKAA